MLKNLQAIGQCRLRKRAPTRSFAQWLENLSDEDLRPLQDVTRRSPADFEIPRFERVSLKHMVLRRTDSSSPENRS